MNLNVSYTYSLQGVIRILTITRFESRRPGSLEFIIIRLLLYVTLNADNLR